MKKIIKKYRISKYHRFMSGLLFAVIALVALFLCVSAIYHHATQEFRILLPFVVAVVSMFLGFLVMFHNNGTPEGSV
ncbi:MAG: hypothetical protein GX359_04050 [Clostridiales bacterium]|nr:hypothetical protein [Clostridiales bacterium]